MNSTQKLVMALAVVSALAAGCSFLQRTIANITQAEKDLEESRVADDYTPSEEYYIGRGTSSYIVQTFPMADPDNAKTREQIKYLNEMGGYIHEASAAVPRDYMKLGKHVVRDEDERRRIRDLVLFKGVQIGLLDTDDVCAFGTTGGFIWISRGAIKMCRSEDELAALVCHELGHVMMNHSMDAYRAANKNAIVAGAVSKSLFPGDSIGSKFGQMVVGLGEDMITKGFNKDQEFEADHWGTRALAATGYDPNAMVRLLESVQAYEKANSGKSQYLGNHPKVTDRMEKVKQAIKDMIAAKEMPEEFKSMKEPGPAARQGRFEQTFKR